MNSFIEPTRWLGLPFDLCFIFSEFLENLFTREESFLDVNKTEITTASLVLDDTDPANVHRLMLTEEPDPDTEFIDVWLDDRVAGSEGDVAAPESLLIDDQFLESLS